MRGDHEMRVSVPGLVVAVLALLLPARGVAQPACDMYFHTVSWYEGYCGTTTCDTIELRWDPCPPGGDGRVCTYQVIARGPDPTCIDLCNLSKPNCHDVDCGACADESCDGTDGTGGGGTNSSRDEGACGDDDDCSNWRTDPVHVGSGAFVTETQVDVQFAGSALPIRFARHYTSLDGWRRILWFDHDSNPSTPMVRRPDTRLAPGWLTTFDERLFAANARDDVGAPVSGTEALVVVHRRDNGRGRAFSCPPPHAPGATFECGTPDDGSVDVLRWNATASRWEIEDGEGTVTAFAASGRLSSKYDPAGAGWSVNYFATGDEAGLIDYVQDEYGRQLRFTWDVAPSEVARLTTLRDATSTVLATFEYAEPLAYLTRAASAAGDETYEYLTEGVDSWPYLTRIQRNGSTVTDVTYEKPWNAGASEYRYTGRVGSIVAADGTFEFRYANAANNLCGDAPYAFDETRTSMIVDRSIPAASGSTTCGVDADCASGHACASGYCRPFTCQEYVTPTGSPPGSTANFSALGALSGNCACGGGSTRTWIQTSGGGTRITSSTARDGTVTTFEYDTEGRLIERCEGDVDADGDPSTCDDIDPVTGANRAVWTSFAYDTTWPDRVSLERTRSRVSPTGYADTEYEYNSTTGRLRFVRREGYTRDTTDTVLGPITEVTEYRYDSLGRLEEQLGPANERSVYTYWPSGSGNATGMLRYEDQYVDATTYLRTTYSSYTTLGQPVDVLDPAGTTTTYGYEFGGMRLKSVKIAGQTTTMSYDAAGRLWRIVEPTGRSIQYTYDGLGRVLYEDVFESGFTGFAERLAYGYDTAGRRTSIAAQRINGSGGLVATTFTWSATYNAQGYRATETRGSQGAVTYTYDSTAMGYLESLTRGDGNLETYVNDDFGRHAQITRHFVTNSFTGTHQLRHVNATASNRDVGDDAPTTVTDPGGAARQYVYDDFGHLVRSSSSEWGTIRWRWTQDRLTEMLRPDGVTRTTFQYDGLGRVTFIDNNASYPSLLGQDYGFAYDNGDGAITCPTAYSCAYRKGRLARVSVEYAPGSFWQMYYDYVADGQVGAERWPDGRETVYTYDTGRLIRTRFPARSTDAVRYDYDTTLGDAHDPTEVRRIVGERSGDIVTWANNIERDSLGRVRKVTPHDSPNRPTEVSWRTDGRVQCWWVYRRTGSTTSAAVADRCYTFSSDGSATGHDTLVTADLARTFFYDGGNRLTCAASTYGASTCPTGSSLVERYVYDEADNREEMQSAAGTTTYVMSGNSLWDEYPPSRTIWYSIASGGGRYMDREVTSGAPSNQRTYTYDADGRLSVMTVPRPTATPSSTRENHTISILYDHRARPLVVIDHNDATGAESRWLHYYDLQDRLLNWVVVPNASAPTTYQVYSYVHIEPALIGTNRAEYVSGSFSSEQWAYYATAPEGLPAAAYTFDRTTLATAEAWRGQWGPFGTMLSETGDAAKWRPPFRFEGQVALPNSDASWWSGSTMITSRQGLVLNRWRVYDPRVGQYLQPEPVLSEGLATAPHPYAYAGLAPLDHLDPTGRDWDDFVRYWCTNPANRHSPLCRFLTDGGRRIPGVCPAPGPRPASSSGEEDDCLLFCGTLCLGFDTAYAIACFIGCMAYCYGRDPGDPWPPEPH